MFYFFGRLRMSRRLPFFYVDYSYGFVYGYGYYGLVSIDYDLYASPC
jgi:hypothetical protein